MATAYAMKSTGTDLPLQHPKERSFRSMINTLEINESIVQRTSSSKRAIELRDRNLYIVSVMIDMVEENSICAKVAMESVHFLKKSDSQGWRVSDQIACYKDPVIVMDFLDLASRSGAYKSIAHQTHEIVKIGNSTSFEFAIENLRGMHSMDQEVVDKYATLSNSPARKSFIEILGATPLMNCKVVNFDAQVRHILGYDNSLLLEIGDVQFDSIKIGRRIVNLRLHKNEFSAEKFQKAKSLKQYERINITGIVNVPNDKSRVLVKGLDYHLLEENPAGSDSQLLRKE